MEHFKLSFSVAGKVIEISSHDQKWVEKKEKEYKREIDDILSVEPQKAVYENNKQRKSDISERNIIKNKISINEFYRTYIHGSKIKSQPDIATFFIYYKEKIEKIDDFSPNDIKDLFKKCGYPNANKINISDVLAKAKKKAFLNNFDGKWTLTITGEDFVLNNISEING